ncbi:MAG TPA: hypothetical protein VFJ19_04110 [Nocardioidaceae bacterium]|nr:hypothetical protein [Nocardioidaceae bacterium]
MFIQVIESKSTRQDEVRALSRRWVEELSPGARGWLGGTFGFTEDDRFVGVVRFESREAATANSGRAEQGEWAMQMAKLMDEPARFHDCDEAMTMFDGGSDSAGFVQVVRGRVGDRAQLEGLMTDTGDLHRMRPEIIGATLGIDADGSFFQTVSFTSEESARASEQQLDMPADVRDRIEAAMRDVSYLDLRAPWFTSPV